MALFPLDPSERDSQGCARLCAGGTPALPGGLHPNETVTPRGGQNTYLGRNAGRQPAGYSGLTEATLFR